MSSEKKGNSVSDNAKIDLAGLADTLERFASQVFYLENVLSVLTTKVTSEYQEYGGVAFCAMKATGSLSDEISDMARKLITNAETGGQGYDQ